jgi:hypothetical protein
LATTKYTVKQIRDYLTCPKRYELYYVHGLRRPRPVTIVARDIHEEVFGIVLRERLDKAEHYRLFREKFEEAIAGLGFSQYQKRTVLSQTDLITRIFHDVVAHPRRHGIGKLPPHPWKTDGVYTIKVRDREIEVKVPLISGTRAVMVWVTCWQVAVKSLLRRRRCIYELGMQMLALKNYEHGVLWAGMIGHKPPVHYFHHELTFPKKHAYNATWDAIKGIENEWFHRCLPMAVGCSRTRCEFHDVCTRYQEGARRS